MPLNARDQNRLFCTPAENAKHNLAEPNSRFSCAAVAGVDLIESRVASTR
jgi:hypothetical protein